MQEPIEIDVDGHEQIVARVAGIDVAKASGMVCTRVPHESIPGRRVTKVWPVSPTPVHCWNWPIIWCVKASSGWCWSRPRITCEVRVHEIK